MNSKFPQVYLDICIGSKAAGRVVFELFSDLTPRTAENFRGLCTGEYGNMGLGARTKKLHYLGSIFHTIIDGFVIKGGDITKDDGSGGHSIYGPTFPDENFQRRHACAGLLSMENKGRNSNSSQFLITLKACPHLDGKHVVFGQVIEGMEVVRAIAKVGVDFKDKPKIPVVIIDCGQVNDPRNFMKYDPFQSTVMSELHENKKILYEAMKESRGDAPHITDFQEENEIVMKLTETNKDSISKPTIIPKPRPSFPLQNNENLEVQNEIPLKSKLSAKNQERMLEIRMKRNEAMKKNREATEIEEKKASDRDLMKNQKIDIFRSKQESAKEALEFKGIDVDKPWLNMSAIELERFNNRKRKSNETFGWEVFNEDSLYRAYKKRCKELSFYKETYDQQKETNGEDYVPTENKVNSLVESLQKQDERKKKFSRRRIFIEDHNINYINERNRVYNTKLERHFAAYTSEIRNNLERGTAQ